MSSDEKKVQYVQREYSFLTDLNIILGFAAGAVWCHSRQPNGGYAYICEHPLSSVLSGAIAGSVWAIPTAWVDSFLPKVFKPALALALGLSIASYVKNM